jgi:hypothetical protein
MGEKRKMYKFLWESPKERGHSKDRGVNGYVGTELMLGRLARGWSGCIWLRIGTGGGLF